MSSFAMLVLFAATASAASLIDNGSFETPVVPVGGFTNFSTGSTLITGWTVVGPEVSIVNNTYSSLGITFPAEDGVQWLDLTGDLANSDLDGVEQTVSTVPGTTYNLSYFVGNVVDSSTYGTTSTVDVLIDGSLLTASENTGGTSTTQTWEQFQTSFVASSSSTVIEFRNGDPATDNTNGLDNVTLTAGASGSTVPEPATSALMLAIALGCAGLFAFRKIRA